MGIFSLIKDAEQALATAESNSELTRTDGTLYIMLYGLVYDPINDTFDFVDFGSHLLRKVEEAKTLPRHVTKMTEDMLFNDYLVALAAISSTKNQEGHGHQTKEGILVPNIC